MVLSTFSQIFLDARREPFALQGWILEILHCDPKGSRAFFADFADPSYGRAIAYVGRIQDLKDLKVLT